MPSLPTSDYEKEGERVKDRFLEILINTPQEQWKLVKESDGIKISSKRSEELGGSMFKSEGSFVVLPASPERVFAMVCPVKPYRVQWDDLLDRLETAKKLDSTRYLIYHVTHSALKGVVSARDSLDVVTMGETEEYFFVAAGGVEHEDYGENPKYVRTLQYPAGYVIHKIPGKPEECKWTMLLHIDLSLNSVVSWIVDKVKPSLMIQKVQALRKGLATITVPEKDLGIKGLLEGDTEEPNSGVEADKTQSTLDGTQPSLDGTQSDLDDTQPEQEITPEAE